MSNWVRTRIRLVFPCVMLLLAGTLGWLAWRLLAQDQQLAAQRLNEQRDTAADLVVALLEKRLGEIQRELDHILNHGEPAGTPSEGDALVLFSANTVRVWPEHSLAYYPELREEPEAQASLFTVADVLQFQKHDFAGAIAAFQRLADSGDARVRAAAMAGMARNYLNAGQVSEALKTYGRLAGLGGVRVAGMPAALAAEEGVLWVHERQKEQDACRLAAEKLSRDSRSGEWPVNAAAYQFLSEEVARYLPGSPRRENSREAAAEGAEQLRHQWAAGAGPGSSTDSTLLLWRSGGGRLAGYAASTRFPESVAGSLKSLLDAGHVRLVLADADGRQVFGAAPDKGERASIRLASATQLPWTVSVFNSIDSAGTLQSRRNLLLAVLGVLLALILAGSWFIGNAVTRELALARLQSDFVSSVSHEFRTPLTTLCQLSELLVRGRVAGDEDRQEYYGLLLDESQRLRRLVETLLSFGRLEAGRMQLRFEQLDAAALLRQTATEFESGQQARGRHLEVAICDSCMVRGDRETLRCVFWNLFENAVKYSPDCNTVWIDMARNNGQAEIAVRDRGVGIPRGEQKRIFEKFVRGSGARDVDIRGTGIGLALAREIVREHSGEITVESEPGQGSTFRVRLPGVDA